MKLRERILKRLLDLLIAVPTLVFLAPLLLVVALIVKLDSRCLVFFDQNHVGKSNNPFAMCKFRSMRSADCESDGNVSTQRDNARIRRVGKLIHATNIHELPQLQVLPLRIPACCKWARQRAAERRTVGRGDAVDPDSARTQQASDDEAEQAGQGSGRHHHMRAQAPYQANRRE